MSKIHDHDQQICLKRYFNFTKNQGNINQNHNEIPFYIYLAKLRSLTIPSTEDQLVFLDC